MNPAGAAPRILIVRLSALGDVVMASGLIPALRSVWPQAHVAWLTEPAAAPLLAHNPRLDEVLLWRRGDWLKLWRERRFGALWRELRDFRRRLRAQRFDLVLDAQGLLKSALCARWTGAPRRIALRAREGGQWLATEQLQPPVGADERIGAEYRFLARHLGADDAAFRLDLAVGEAPRAAAQALLAARQVDGAYAVLCPFTTRPQKHWFEEHWVALAGAFARRGLVPVLLGGPGDVPAAERLARACPALVDLTGRLPLDQSAAVVEGARLLVGVDTGLTHMGSALQVPTVALFGSTRPYTAAAPRTTILYEAMDCAPCRRHPTCGGAFHCMRALTVERVMGHAVALLDTVPA